ncbi:MAG: murein transglycosylase A [Rhodospirillales bacterium]
MPASVLARLLLVVLTALAGCAPRPAPPALNLQPASFAALSGWTEDDHGQALLAFVASCSRQPGSNGIEAWQRLGVSPETLAAVCAAAAAVPHGDREAARAFFEERFVPALASNNGKPEGLFTGYYEPELRGSKHRSGPFQVPIHRPPDNLVSIDLGAFRPEWNGQQLIGQLSGQKVVPVPARADIDRGALSGRDLELFWVDSAVDAFFLHIQGSGRVVLEDGRAVRVGFAGKNGRPYFAIGRELIRRGAIAEEQMSMQAIRDWLAAHPDEAVAVMAMNPSYVFFREIDGPGPVGAQNIVLTPGRSLAVDPAFIALGVPLWLESEEPPTKVPLRRLVVAQDTGGAIKGPVRGDLFWGSGAAPGERAGAMKAEGRYYLLIPKTEPPTTAQAPAPAAN